MQFTQSVARQTAYACIVLRLAETLMYALNITPFLRLVEANVCRNYYRIHNPSLAAGNIDIPEKNCKVAAVQSAVSNLNGTFLILTTIPTILAALPYLSSSRLVNKKRVLLINVISGLMMNVYYGAVLYFYNIFDPRWIWLNGLFSFIGGGDLVLCSLLPALMAESIPAKSLTIYYLYTTTAALAVKVGGSATSLAIMKTSVWLPVILSIAVKALEIPIILLFVTSITDGKINDDSRKGRPLLQSDEPEMPVGGTEASGDGDKQSTLSRWRSIVVESDITRRLMTPITICALQEAGKSVRSILPYWFSTRYKWTLRESGWIFLYETILTMVIVSITPKLSKYYFKDSGSHEATDRDMKLTKAALAFSMLGTALLGLSWYIPSAVVSLSILAAGAPFQDAYMGYITASLEKHEIAQFYMVLSIVALAAYSVGGWVIAAIYSISLSLGGSWGTSVPIWTCSLAFGVTLFYVR